MAIAVAVKKTINLNTGILVLADVTLDTTYAAGGYAVTPAQFGLSNIDQILAGAPAVGGLIPTYDGVGVNKLKMWTSTTGAPALTIELTDVDVSTSVVPCMVFGS